jgi:hypothetical protein
MGRIIASVSEPAVKLTRRLHALGSKPSSEEFENSPMYAIRFASGGSGHTLPSTVNGSAIGVAVHPAKWNNANIIGKYRTFKNPE